MPDQKNCYTAPWRMVFDVESIGLHGEGFAVGWVLIDPDGNEADSDYAACATDDAQGADDDREWVKANVVPALTSINEMTPETVRHAFWLRYQELKREHPGLELWTDCGWPVEANFLSACVRDASGRTWEGPYPLLDVANVLLAAGKDPLGSYGRLPNEEPAHNPLNDARQSARVLLWALAGAEGERLRAGRDDAYAELTRLRAVEAEAIWLLKANCYDDLSSGSHILDRCPTIAAAAQARQEVQRG